MEVLLVILGLILLLITPVGRGIIYLTAWLAGVLCWLAIIGGIVLLVVGLTT